MKIKDPKTGIVFKTMFAATNYFCSKNRPKDEDESCDYCKLNKVNCGDMFGGLSACCPSSYTGKPEVVVSIMGYKLLEDDDKDGWLRWVLQMF